VPASYHPHRMPARLSSPDLVGRDDALAAVTGAIGAAATGPRFVVVRGEAGIGKTRLVREAIAQLPDDTLVMLGDCLDIGTGGLPYLPIVEALRRLARTADPATLAAALGKGRAELVALVPELAGTGSQGAPGSTATEPPPEAALAQLTTGLAQARLFERILGLLGALAGRAPVVLVIEDVHWIDRATRDLLTFLARNLTEERIAILLTFREHDLPRGHPIVAWLAEIERSPSTVLVEPGRLDARAIARQLRLIAGHDVAADIIDRVARRSDGNPLFVEELYASEGDHLSGPRSLTEVLIARIAKLDPPARAVVDAAAVAGRPVEERLLALVLEIPEADVDEALRAAIAGWVLLLDAARERYRFRHELLREVVEDELLPGTRRRLHERFAVRLQERPDLADPSPAGAAGELAVHFAEAGLAEEAYEHSIRAADAADAVHAYADAYRHLERALDIEPKLPALAADTAGRIALRRRTADNADDAGELERSLELTREALALVDRESDPVTTGVLHSSIGYLQWSLGQGQAALASHELAVALVPPEPPSAERAKVLGGLAGALMGEGRWAPSRVVAEAAVECAVAVGARVEESRARNILGSDLVALGHSDAGIEELREACRLAAASGRVDMLVVGHHNLALNLAASDQLEASVEEARAGLAVARDAGVERRFGQDLAALAGDALTRLGRLDEAAEAMGRGLALDPAGRGTVYLSIASARLAAIRGNAADAARRRAEIDQPALDPDDAAYVAAVGAESRLLVGDAPGALAEVEAGLVSLEGLDDVIWATPLVALGLRAVAEMTEAVRMHAGSPDATDATARLADRLDWLATRVTTSSGRGLVALGRGELARVRSDDGADAWRTAIEAFDAVPEPLNAAYARFRFAEAGLRAEGLRADVGRELQQAASTAVEAGARPLAEAIGALAGRARITLDVLAAAPADEAPQAVAPATRPADPRAAASALGLSAREIEVLELVTAGMTNGEIADRLFITRKTAAVHVTHILDKLGVPNRVSAAMIGARVGLGAPAEDDEASTTSA
jgi:DNA-binding CsgD family transcriptional regulator/tetratricopeptide (TPR) repeat protein